MTNLSDVFTFVKIKNGKPFMAFIRLEAKKSDVNLIIRIFVLLLIDPEYF